MNLRLATLKVLLPLTKAIGKIHVPFTHKEVNGKHFFSILPHLRPGAVFLSYKKGELANSFIPGQFSHAAIYGYSKSIDSSGNSLDYHYVVEATTAGVAITDLISFMTSKDRVCLLDPLFCDDIAMNNAEKYAESMLGKPYDFLFDKGDSSFFCSELIQKAYEVSAGAIFTTRKRFGVETVIPNDFYDSSKSKVPKWKVVYDSHQSSSIALR